MTPKITSIKMSTSAPRKKPRVGDIRETKANGIQIRIFKKVYDSRGNSLGYDCTGGKQRHEWVSFEEAEKKGYGYKVAEYHKAQAAPSKTFMTEGMQNV